MLRRVALIETGGHEGVIRNDSTGETRTISHSARYKMYKKAWHGLNQEQRDKKAAEGSWIMERLTRKKSLDS